MKNKRRSLIILLISVLLFAAFLAVFFVIPRIYSRLLFGDRFLPYHCSTSDLSELFGDPTCRISHNENQAGIICYSDLPFIGRKAEVSFSANSTGKVYLFDATVRFNSYNDADEM